LGDEKGGGALEAPPPGGGGSPPPPFFRSARRGGREWAPVVWLIVAMRAYIGERGVGREGERGPRGRESGGREGVPVTKRERDRVWCLLIYFLRFLSSDCVLNRQRKLVWFSLSVRDTT